MKVVVYNRGAFDMISKKPVELSHEAIVEFHTEGGAIFTVQMIGDGRIEVHGERNLAVEMRSGNNFNVRQL